MKPCLLLFLYVTKCTCIFGICSLDHPIQIWDGEFSWSSAADDASTLKKFVTLTYFFTDLLYSCLIFSIRCSIDMHVERGQLLAVVGSVGCGKSSLISAILGEMTKRRGRVNVTV